jgi:cytochrome c
MKFPHDSAHPNYACASLRRLSLASYVVAFWFVSSAVAADSDTIAKGRAILAQNCARCHAIGMTDTSPHPQAPPFRSVVLRYPVEDLAESLAEGIVSGHPDMPVFTFEPDQIDAILAYLNSLKGAKKSN